MEFFPALQTLAETEQFIKRMQQQCADKGYCYFAVDKLDDGAFIGFIGLSEKTFEADFTPCVDIGWRLARETWNNGYAYEGAKRCLDYGLLELGLKKIVAIAPVVNVRSEYIMKKIGMAKVGDFLHPLLLNDERLKHCVLYEAKP
jgi:RimJ/RimL family protein N-acetyltransferase